MENAEEKTIFILQLQKYGRDGGYQTILVSPDKDSIYRYIHNETKTQTLEEVSQILDEKDEYKYHPQNSKSSNTYKIIETPYYGYEWEPYNPDGFDLYDYYLEDDLFDAKDLQKKIDRLNAKNIDYTYKGKPISRIIKDILKEAKKKGFLQGPSKNFSIQYIGNKFIWNPNAKSPELPRVIIYQEESESKSQTKNDSEESEED